MDPRRHPEPPTLAAAEHRAPRRSVRALTMIVATMFSALSSMLSSPAHAGDVDAASVTAESLALCAAADDLAPEQRSAVLAQGLALADAAVAADAQSARAHFAVVCNLGKATGLGGVGFGTLRAVYRLRREMDVTLELAPNDADALAAKGALLARLPRVLGGDAEAAEELLRRALAVDPEHGTARTYLDELLRRRGFISPAAETAAIAR